MKQKHKIHTDKHK